MGLCRKIVGLSVIAVAVYIGYVYNTRDTFQPESIRGKRVIVTGASTGIGEQIAYHYARLGAKILITARRENLLEEVTAKCVELGAQEVHYLPMDMAVVNETGKLISEAEEKLGGLDYLVLNHALYYWELWDGNMEKLQNVMNVNFMSFVNLATEALPMLTKTNGSIAVVSSLSGIFALPSMIPYSVSKSAITGFFTGWRQELALRNTNVSVTLCLIGSIKTAHAAMATEVFLNLESRFESLPSPDETALRIIQASASRAAVLIFPYFQSRKCQLLNTFFPELLQRLTSDNVDTKHLGL